jgi:hypothetical protein
MNYNIRCLTFGTGLMPGDSSLAGDSSCVMIVIRLACTKLTTLGSTGWLFFGRKLRIFKPFPGKAPLCHCAYRDECPVLLFVKTLLFLLINKHFDHHFWQILIFLDVFHIHLPWFTPFNRVSAMGKVLMQLCLGLCYPYSYNYPYSPQVICGYRNM